jgi:hypothetical protein
MSDDISRLGRSAHTPEAVGHDDPEWMAMFSTLDDHEVDGLLAGLPPDDADLAPLAEVAAMLRRSAAEERVPTMSATLRAQLAGPPVVALAARRASRSALIKAGAAAAAAVAVVTLGVGATQNRLPAGLQDVLSSTANLVGIHVPTADERPSHSNGGSEPSDHAPEADDPGHEGTTPGGATPADPGTPGDKEPATPATPPEQSNGTPGENNGTIPDPPGPQELPPPAATLPPAVTQPTPAPSGDTSAPVEAAAPEEPVAPDEPGNGPPSGRVTGSSRGNPSEVGELNGTGASDGPADPAAGDGTGGPGAGRAPNTDAGPPTDEA